MSEISNYPFMTVVSGELQGSATAVQCPDIPVAGLIYIKALASNAGNVYIGGAGVTIADGTTDATSGYQLAPGDAAPPLNIDNLNRLYRICDNAGDDITYLITR